MIMLFLNFIWIILVLPIMTSGLYLFFRKAWGYSIKISWKNRILPFASLVDKSSVGYDKYKVVSAGCQERFDFYVWYLEFPSQPKFNRRLPNGHREKLKGIPYSFKIHLIFLHSVFLRKKWLKNKKFQVRTILLFIAREKRPVTVLLWQG